MLLYNAVIINKLKKIKNIKNINNIINKKDLKLNGWL